MVIGVKFLSTRNYKGRCRDCNRTFRNGDLCVYERDTVLKRHHSACNVP